MRVKVEAYSGYTANERPLRFTLGDRTLEVTEIVDRWYGEAERYFRVTCDDGDTYVLKYLESEDWWEIASFTRKGSQGTNFRGDRPKTLH
jgi:hypothetical protein